jgi:asparaginyl-tRNA synthetase
VDEPTGQTEHDTTDTDYRYPAAQPVGDSVEVSGWLRTRRDSGSLAFLEMNDGSCLANLQVIAEGNLANFEAEVKKLSTGCALRVHGVLVASPAKGQAVEVRAEAITVIGWADPETYPAAEKAAQL